MLIPKLLVRGSLLASDTLREGTASSITRRGNESTASALSGQWINPTDVSTILMVIGGDVVQKALAQGTGKYFTPVCFSFGCVAYAFTALVDIIGDGRLLPAPDYPVKVFNLTSGYGKENRNWVLGRILRDLETRMAKEARSVLDQSPGLRITIWDALENLNGPTRFSWRRLHMFGAVVVLLQFVIAAIPAIPSVGGDWSVLFITAVGTVLIQMIGVLPQWVAEKLPNRQHAKGTYALTTGIGSHDVMVIRGNGLCLHLEEMANADSPRKGWVWQKFHTHKLLSWQTGSATPALPNKQMPARTDSELSERWQSRYAGGFPFGFWLTRAVLIVTSILSLLLLVNVSAPKKNGWFILLVGGIGMFQNGVIAGMELSPAARNLPLVRREVIRTRKVMDGLMDFHSAYDGMAHCLLKEFFPGPLQDAEEKWWNGQCDEYENQRLKDQTRGKPLRRRMTTCEVSVEEVERKQPVPVGQTLAQSDKK